MTAAVDAPPAPRPPAVRWRWPSLPLLALILIVLVAALAPVLAPQDPARQALLARLKPPLTTIRGVTYWLGTDEVGRDLLSRVIFGARISLTVAGLSVVVSGTLGTALGLIAGYVRGLVDPVIMRLVDIVLSVPPLLLAIITVAVVGPNIDTLVLVLGLTRWPRYTRVAYAQTLTVATLPYIMAAKLAGASPGRILLRHILPNILGPMTVVATLEFGLMVLFEAGLSFLGLGVQPPTPSWGAILNVGRNYIDSAWWIGTFPGLCLFAVVLTINLLGDRLRDRFDPRLSP